MARMPIRNFVLVVGVVSLALLCSLLLLQGSWNPHWSAKVAARPGIEPKGPVAEGQTSDPLPVPSDLAGKGDRVGSAATGAREEASSLSASQQEEYDYLKGRIYTLERALEEFRRMKGDRTIQAQLVLTASIATILDQTGSYFQPEPGVRFKFPNPGPDVHVFEVNGRIYQVPKGTYEELDRFSLLLDGRDKVMSQPPMETKSHARPKVDDDDLALMIENQSMTVLDSLKERLMALEGKANQ